MPIVLGENGTATGAAMTHNAESRMRIAVRILGDSNESRFVKRSIKKKGL
jgi:hypothetical protein